MKYLFQEALKEHPVVVDHVDVLRVLLPPPGHLPEALIQTGKVCCLKTSKLTSNLLARGTYVYFAILVEVEELVEEVCELLHLEG